MDVNVKGYVYSADALDEFEATLSPERFATYLCAVGGDKQSAARLYTWNTAVSAAFYGPLQALEVAVRNAMHTHLTRAYGENWYTNQATGLDSQAQSKVSQTKNDLKRKSYAVDPPDVIAGLSFGFWVSLLRGGGQINPNKGANYEMTLWRPALRWGFPHATSLKRQNAHEPLNSLRIFRNRIAHHEPVFTRDLEQYYQDILKVMAWVCPHKRAWLEAHCRVLNLLAMRKDDPSVRF